MYKEFYGKKKFSTDGETSKSYLPSATEFRVFLWGSVIVGIIAAVAYGFYMYKTKIEVK